MTTTYVVDAARNGPPLDFSTVEEAETYVAEHPLAEIVPARQVEKSRPVRCVCGYQATDIDDLDEHILALVHASLPGEHNEAR